MKIRIILILSVIIKILLLLSCDDNKDINTIQKGENIDLFYFLEERTTKNTINCKEISKLDILENLEIVYFDLKQNLIFFRSSLDTNKIYYSSCKIDSAFYANLSNKEHQDKVFLGSFFPTEQEKVKITFISIYSFDKQNNKYQNSYNTFYYVDKSFVDINIISDFFEGRNALFVANYEGSGNFLQVNILAKQLRNIADITPELPPLSQGDYIIDSGRVILMEGLSAWEITESLEKSDIIIKQLDSLPIIDFRDGDKIIRLKRIENRIVPDSKLYVCNWTGVIHLQINEPNNGLAVNFDPKYFKRKLNQLIPIQKGYTNLELIDTDFNFVISNIKVIIN